MVRECLMVHIGQGGVQVGHACWELFALEHGVNPNGSIYDMGYQDGSLNTFFRETGRGSFVPRAIMMDLEPTVIDEVRTGTYRHFFDPGMLITGKEDAANCFGIGYYTAGQEFLDVVLDRVRRQVETCDAFQGFMIARSVGGGTGSGFTSCLLHNLYEFYTKPSRLTIDIFPSPRIHTSTVEPYNAAFAMHYSTDTANVSNIFDNEAVYEICRRHLDIRRPGYTNVNRLIAQVISSMMTGVRYPGSGVNVNLEDFQTNLIPFPRIRYPIISYAPFLPCEKSRFQNADGRELVNSVLSVGNHMVNCDTTYGHYIAATLLFRGDVSRETTNFLSNMRNPYKTNIAPGVKFVDWVPTGFKVGICNIQPGYVPGADLAPVPRCCVGMLNHTAIRVPFQILATKFKKMYKKRAFVHWYVGNGMEEWEFKDTLDNIQALCDDYAQIDKNAKTSNNGPSKADLSVKGRALGVRDTPSQRGGQGQSPLFPKGAVKPQQQQQQQQQQRQRGSDNSNNSGRSSGKGKGTGGNKRSIDGDDNNKDEGKDQIIGSSGDANQLEPRQSSRIKFAQEILPEDIEEMEVEEEDSNAMLSAQSAGSIIVVPSRTSRRMSRAMPKGEVRIILPPRTDSPVEEIDENDRRVQFRGRDSIIDHEATNKAKEEDEANEKEEQEKNDKTKDNEKQDEDKSKEDENKKPPTT